MFAIYHNSLVFRCHHGHVGFMSISFHDTAAGTFLPQPPQKPPQSTHTHNTHFTPLR